jgi:diamine N-acetyltransferase
MTVTLRPLTAENWRECCRLKVSDDQREFVAPNVYSIAETRFEPTSLPLAIYADETMVGFLMYDTKDYYIVRFMIAAQYQGKGYGRAAMELLLAQLEQEYAHPSASLSYVPGNEVAERMYEKVGFRKTGEIHEGEVMMARPLKNPNS